MNLPWPWLPPARFIDGFPPVSIIDGRFHIAMDLKEIMAVNLRRKRHDLQMTQEELAERAGLSARYVGAIERGDVAASVTVLGQIAEALGVEPVDLLRRSSRKG